MSTEAPDSGPKSKIQNRKSRKWVWFFVALGVMGATAIAVNWVFNWWQQLTPGKLQTARRLWEEKRPADYDLVYVKSGSATGQFVVRVRNGKIESVTLDGHPPTRDGRPRPLEDLPIYDMSGLFDDIAEFLERDAQPGSPRAFNRAEFDPDDGHLTRYVRSARSFSAVSSEPAEKQRLEINVKQFERVQRQDGG